jgi:hypothetical protein
MEFSMADKISTAEGDADKQVLQRRHDAGSGANETTDGLDATTETLRQAAEDMPSGASPEDMLRPFRYSNGPILRRKSEAARQMSMKRWNE